MYLFDIETDLMRVLVRATNYPFERHDLTMNPPYLEQLI
jgi:hypothetical protein